MKLHQLLLLTVGLLIGADAPKDDAANKELKKLEGSYVMISGEEKGDKLPETTVKNAKLTIEGDKCTVKVGDETVVGIHKLDPTKKPKAIDRKDTAGMFKGKTALGIYKLEKGEFTICFAAPGKERPTEFTTKSGTGVFLYVWKQQEGWVYHSKEHGFSMKLPSSYWREAKSKSLVAFTHVSLPMKAFVTSVKQGPKETFEASVQRLKDFLDKNGDQLLQKPEVVEQEDKAGNKRWCVVLKEKGRDGAEYMLVGISYTWIKEKGITIETEFEGSMTAKSNYFKALEKESFEKSVKEICLSVE
jgi:uncharacterized protein (TIGR03067 family)